MKTMRAAIIGIGAIARLHARALGDIAGVELVAATCRTEEKGRAFAQEFGCEWYADADTLLTLMAQDKKVKRGRLTFILLEQIGKAVIVNDVDPPTVRDFLQEKLSG